MVTGPTKSLLWLDDHIEALAGYVQRLRESGFEVTTASNLPEALKRLRERPFDLIMTDFVVGSDNGTALLEKVRKQSRKAKIIVVSGYTHSDHLRDTISELRDDDVSVLDKASLPLSDASPAEDTFIRRLHDLASESGSKSDQTVLSLIPLDKRIRVNIRFAGRDGPELVGDFDSNSGSSFVSYEWLLDNNLVHKAENAETQMLFGGQRIIGHHMEKQCFLAGPGGSHTKTVMFKFFAVRDWANSPVANVATNKLALIGRNILVENNLGLSITDQNAVAMNSSFSEWVEVAEATKPLSVPDFANNQAIRRKKAYSSLPYPRTKIGKAVAENKDQLTLSATALLLLVDQKLVSLRAQRPNSSEAIRQRDEEIAHYESFRQPLEAFTVALKNFVGGTGKEKSVVSTTKTFAEGVRSWWTTKHQQICDRSFDMALFLSAVGVCATAGAGGVMSVAVSGALVGGKPVVDALKSIGKSFAKEVGKDESHARKASED